MTALREKLVGRIALQLGVPIDGDLTELVEFANDNFDLNIELRELAINPVAAHDAIMDLAASAEVAIHANTSAAKLFHVTAAPVGKPKIVAVVVIGGG